MFEEEDLDFSFVETDHHSKEKSDNKEEKKELSKKQEQEDGEAGDQSALFDDDDIFEQSLNEITLHGDLTLQQDIEGSESSQIPDDAVFKRPLEPWISPPPNNTSTQLHLGSSHGRGPPPVSRGIEPEKEKSRSVDSRIVGGQLRSHKRLNSSCNSLTSESTNSLISVSGKEKRRFPGPAGILNKLEPGTHKVMRREEEEEQEESDPPLTASQQVEVDPIDVCVLWKRALIDLDMNRPNALIKTYNISWIHEKTQQSGTSKKIPFLLAKLKSLDLERLDPQCVLMDQQGEVNGSFHRLVYEQYGMYLGINTVLAMKDVAILVTPRTDYVIITLNNIISIYTPGKEKHFVRLTNQDLKNAASLLDQVRQQQKEEIANELRMLGAAGSTNNLSSSSVQSVDQSATSVIGQNRYGISGYNGGSSTPLRVEPGSYSPNTPHWNNSPQTPTNLNAHPRLQTQSTPHLNTPRPTARTPNLNTPPYTPRTPSIETRLRTPSATNIRTPLRNPNPSNVPQQHKPGFSTASLRLPTPSPGIAADAPSPQTHSFRALIRPPAHCHNSVPSSVHTVPANNQNRVGGPDRNCITPSESIEDRVGVAFDSQGEFRRPQAPQTTPKRGKFNFKRPNQPGVSPRQPIPRSSAEKSHQTYSPATSFCRENATVGSSGSVAGTLGANEERAKAIGHSRIVTKSSRDQGQGHNITLSNLTQHSVGSSHSQAVINELMDDLEDNDLFPDF